MQLFVRLLVQTRANEYDQANTNEHTQELNFWTIFGKSISAQRTSLKRTNTTIFFHIMTSSWITNTTTNTVGCCCYTLHWHHNDHIGVSNHQPRCCLFNRLFRRRSKITSKLRVTGLCAGNSPGPVNSPHKGPVTRKMFPFDDVIMR